MNIVAIIPARGGSKGIPRKNIQMLAGKPLIAYSIEAGINSKYINKVILSTEDDEIAQVGQNFGAEVIKRPLELAKDTTKTAPVLVQVIEQLEEQGYIPDIIVLLQPTSPLRTTEQINQVLDKLINSKNDSVFTGFYIGEAMPKWQKLEDGSFKALYDYHLRPRRQDIHLRGNLYSEDGSIYTIKYNAFKKYKDFIGENASIHVVPRQIDIDSIEEFRAVEEILLKNQK